jgi:hypothetical protein
MEWIMKESEEITIKEEANVLYKWRNWQVLILSSSHCGAVGWGAALQAGM